MKYKKGDIIGWYSFERSELPLMTAIVIEFIRKKDTYLLKWNVDCGAISEWTKREVEDEFHIRPIRYMKTPLYKKLKGEK